jgi:hypothetical protein
MIPLDMILHLSTVTHTLYHLYANLPAAQAHNLGAPIQAVASPVPTPPTAAPNSDAGKNLVEFANYVEALVRVLGITIFLIGVAIAGIMRMLSFGSDRRVAMSNMALTAAVVGLLILVLASTLGSLIMQAFGATGQ